MPEIQESTFSFINDPTSRRYVADAYQAVTVAEAWPLMAKDPGEGGFMFTTNEAYKTIRNHMELRYDHSGSSYGWTMRQIQFIAQNGMDAYRNLFIR